ncbi:MAG: PIN domain nuclease [Acidobacteriaceae bacterium]
MVIVDTTVWIDYFAGIVNSQTTWLRRAAGVTAIGLTDLILCEILQGVRRDAELARIQNRLLNVDIFDSGGTVLAHAAARNYRFLRAKGYTVRTTIDLIIATFCLESDHELLHHDRDFDPFEQHLGLKVLHPA